MDESQYHVWWEVHLKSCRGETLTTEEQSIYDSGKTELTVQETVPGNHFELGRQRETLVTLERENERLRRKRKLLAAEIRSLESRLSARAKENLVVGG